MGSQIFAAKLKAPVVHIAISDVDMAYRALRRYPGRAAAGLPMSPEDKPANKRNGSNNSEHERHNVLCHRDQPLMILYYAA